MFSNQLVMDNSQYLRLAISPLIQAKAWEQAQNHSHAIARHNSYINYVSLYTLLDWFTEEAIEKESITKPAIFPHEASLPSILDIVNGTIIQLGEKKIVLLPCETGDLTELSVPQEWVDIPNWAGDYYLAIQVNLEPEEEECWIEICGFVTHRYLKSFGSYNSNNRTYTIAVDDLTKDIMLIEMTSPFKMKAEILDLPKLSALEAQKILDFCGNSSIYSPRLRVNDVSFTQWAALLVNDHWRQELYRRRIDKVKPIFVDLRKWLTNIVDNIVDEIWQPYEALFNHVESVPARGKVVSEVHASNELMKVIQILQSNQIELCYQAAGILGEIGIGNPDAINALTELIHTTKEEKIRWQAAISLGKIDPGNSQAVIRNARLIDLGMQLGNDKLILMVAIMPKPNGKIGVWLKVQPHQKNQLPVNLKLRVLSESGEIIPGLETPAQVGENEQFHHSAGYKSLDLRFTPPSGKGFRVNITLDDMSFNQDFLV